MHDSILESYKAPLKTCNHLEQFYSHPVTGGTDLNINGSKSALIANAYPYEGKMYDILTNTAKYDAVYKNTMKTLQKLIEVTCE